LSLSQLHEPILHSKAVIIKASCGTQHNTPQHYSLGGVTHHYFMALCLHLDDVRLDWVCYI